MIRIVALAVALALLPGAAEAGPIGAAFAAVSSWFAGLGFVGQALIRIGIGLVLSAVFSAKQKTPEQQQQGIKSDVTLTGGANGDTFILGRYATGGMHVCPPIAHGGNNNLLTYVVDLGLAGSSVVSVVVSGERRYPQVTTHPSFGHELVYGSRALADGIGLARGWVKWYTGGQAVADPYLTSVYGGHPDFPWTPDMVGRGRSYAIFTFHFDRDIFNGLPTVRLECFGIPLYDPRKDDTAGGSGGHRWGVPGLSEQTQNPVVMIYNILRGIALPDGSVWGGGVAAEDLPYDVWAAAMNECDLEVTLDGGGVEPQYRAGIEVNVAEDEPARIVDQLLQACDGEIVEEGGTWFIRVGPPALPVYFFTDSDVIVSSPREYTPFPVLPSTVNGVAITFPDPEANWETSEAETILDAGAVAEDGRQLIESISMNAMPYRVQGQRLARAFVKDSRRFRVHALTLPPDAAHIPPLSTVAWTSDANGYAGKVFEVQRKQVQLQTLLTQVALRERDPSDYDWSAADQLPYPVPAQVVTRPPDYALAGLTAMAIKFVSTSGAEGVGILVSGIAADVVSVVFEVALQADLATLTAQGFAEPRGGAVIIVAGVLPASDMAVRLKVAPPGSYAWSEWLTVTTDAVATDVAAVNQRIDDTILYIDAELAQARSELEAGFAAADAAIETRVDTVETSVGDNAAAISAEAISRSDGDSALAADITALNSTVDGIDATVQTQAATLADFEGFAAATYAIRLKAGGAANEVEFVAADDPINGPVSAVRFSADEVLIPGTITAGMIDTRGLDIRDGAGNVIFSAGGTLDYSYVAGGPPANANFVNNTNQLSDGAGLGLTAAWTSVYGSGKPADNADVTSSNHALGTSGGDVYVNAASAPKAVRIAGSQTSVYGLYVFHSTANNGAVYAASPGGFTIQSVNTYGVAGSCAGDFQSTGGASGGGAIQLGLGISGGGWGAYCIRGGFYDASGVGYRPFTGQHDGIILKTATFEPGDIVVDTDVVARKLSDVLTKVELASAPNQPHAVGVITGATADWHVPAAFVDDAATLAAESGIVWGGDPTQTRPVVTTHDVADYSATYDMASINGVGEGCINVCGEGGDIAVGDLIVTSSTPGKGMKQSDDILRACTVARAREAMTFAAPTDTAQIACIYLCG